MSAGGLTVTILGCGGSGGVPQLGGADGRGDWGVCDPAEPRNRRGRSSAVIEAGGRRLLIDAGPDLRTQLLANGIDQVEAVTITHTHADHVMGIDDLRLVNRVRKAPIDLFGSYTSLSELRTRFEYAFRPAMPQGFFRPALVPRPIAPGETVEMAGFQVRVLRQEHRVMETLGFRIGRFAYCTDLVELPAESLRALEGVETWVVGCFQRRPHPVHAHVAQAATWAEELGIRRTVLTHMGTDMDWSWLVANLPPGLEPAFDGMRFKV